MGAFVREDGYEPPISCPKTDALLKLLPHGLFQYVKELSFVRRKGLEPLYAAISASPVVLNGGF